MSRSRIILKKFPNLGLLQNKDIYLKDKIKWKNLLECRMGQLFMVMRR